MDVFDGWVLISAFSGAILFIAQEEEASFCKKIVFIPLAMYVGCLVSGEIMSQYGLHSQAAAAFFGAALVVPVVSKLISAIRKGDAFSLFKRK